MHIHLPHHIIKEHEVTLRGRFMSRVLIPPFVLLILIGGVGFWQLNTFLTRQAINELNTAAETTAVRLERELSLRQVILANTGEEIAFIKGNYTTGLAQLERDRSKCRSFYTRALSFSNSPENVCDRFITEQAPSLSLIEKGYVDQAKELQSIEVDGINQRLASFKQFFPETIAIILVNENGEILSSAISGALNAPIDELATLATNAGAEPVAGELYEIDGGSYAAFATPIEKGGVLALYNVDDTNYLDPSWRDTPIDTTSASAVITQADQDVIYPGVRDRVAFLSSLQSVNLEDENTISLGDVENIVVSENVEGTDWSVLVASPKTIVLSPVRDAQVVSFAVFGLFIVGFLWVSTLFIKKMTDNIAMLVTGAMIYGSGRLDYKIDVHSSEKELKQLAETMNYMAKRIATSEKENDERNKEFISIATHELRAPMTSIIGYLSLFQEGQKRLSKQNKMLLDNAYEGTIKLRDLITDMLDAARLDGGREEFNIEKLSIEDAVSDCVDFMQPVAKENKISLTYDSKGAQAIYADPAKLRIILNNFVSNALKYNHKSGHVRITHTRHKNMLMTSVANSGPTIPADQQEHMFEKFFRVDTPEHKKVTGTGIGMYVTKQYVETMGGEIGFSSAPKEDTVFYFTLPTSNDPKIQKQIKTAPQASDSRWIMRWRKRLR